jgi:hypothetical protein
VPAAVSFDEVEAGSGSVQDGMNKALCASAVLVAARGAGRRSRQALVPERRRVCELQEWEAQESNGRVSTGNGVHDATDSRVEQSLEVGSVSQPVTTRGKSHRGDAMEAAREGKALKGEHR